MIIFYLKYLPGNIYNNTLASTSTALIAVFAGGFMYEKLGIRKSFTILFGLTSIGGFIIIFLGVSNVIWMPIFVVII